MKKGYWYILLAALAFSTMEICCKFVSDQMNPFQLNFIRFLIGAFIFLPFCFREIRKRNLKFKIEDIKFFALGGFLFIVLSMTVFQLAIVYTKASTAAAIYCGNPAFIMIMAHIFLKEELTKQKIICLIINFLGLIFILNPLQIKFGKDLLGIFLAILSAFIVSIYIIMLKKNLNKYGNLVLNTFTFLFGSVELLIIILLSKIPFISYATQKINFTLISNIPLIDGISLNNILILLYIGIVITGIGNLLYVLAIEETSVSLGSVVFFIKLALVPILSFLFLKEKIKLHTLLGIALILFSFITTFKPNKKICKKTFCKE